MVSNLQVVKCKHCKQATSGRIRRGLCNTCYLYKLRTGNPRPKHLFDQQFCKNCHEDAERMIKGECVTCFEYRRRTKRSRPKRLWAKDLTCRNTNCGIPLEFVTRKRGWLCGQCDWYLKKYGRPRPAYLCRPDNHLGWCDCGNVATKKMPVSFGILNGFKRDLLLCQICYKEAKEYEH